MPHGNVIKAVFDPEFFDEVFTSIKYNGIKRTEAEMIMCGVVPSVARASIKRIIKYRGW